MFFKGNRGRGGHLHVLDYAERDTESADDGITEGEQRLRTRGIVLGAAGGGRRAWRRESMQHSGRDGAKTGGEQFEIKMDNFNKAR